LKWANGGIVFFFAVMIAIWFAFGSFWLDHPRRFLLFEGRFRKGSNAYDHSRIEMISTTSPVFGSILFTGEAAPRDPNRNFSRVRRYSASVRPAGSVFLRRLSRRLLVLKRSIGICPQARSPRFAFATASQDQALGGMTKSSSQKLETHPPIASWSHRRQGTQTFAFGNRDIIPRYK
jgi:hypothetical protein